MSRGGNFDTFYNGTRAALLHQTYALTGNLDGAASAVEHGYAHAWSHWAKVSHLDDPLSWVRNEAWRVATSHLPRRRLDQRHRQDGAVSASGRSACLERLGELTTGQRRAVVLHHLAGMEPDQIARQLGVTVPTAENALAFGEAIWAESADPDRPRSPVALADGLRDLRSDTAGIRLMRAAAIRRAGDRRQRRHTLLGVAAAAALLLGGGALISQEPTPGPVLASAEERAGGDAIGDPTGDPPGGAPSAGGPTSTEPTAADEAAPSSNPSAKESDLLSSSDLLTLVDMRRLSKAHDTWAITVSGDGPLNREGAYTWCQRRTLADPEAADIVLRQFEALGSPRTDALQVVEESANVAAARAGFAEMESWFGACQQPGVQLLRTLEVRGLGDQGRAVVLRQGNARPVFATVAVARTGVLTTAVVVTTAGRSPVPPQRVVARLGRNISHLCELGNGSCANRPRVTLTDAMPSPEFAPFLAPLDLPPVSNVRHPWAAVRPTRALDNPSATACDQVDFAAEQRPRARVFVIPEARRLPRSFGLSETVGTFDSPQQAGRFVEEAAERVRECTDREINAEVVEDRAFEVAGMPIRLWTFTFELSDGQLATYHTGLVRRGKAVAQVTLSPTERYDVADADFRGLVIRAGERLGVLR